MKDFHRGHCFKAKDKAKIHSSTASMAYNKSEVLQNRTVTAKMFSGPQNDFQREVRIPSGMWKRM